MRSPAERAHGSTARRLLAPGWLLIGLASATAAAAIHTGNNRLYLVLGAMLALLTIELVLGSWNLRSLTAARRLPPELFAGQRARGEVVLGNPRRLLPAAGLRVRERGHGAQARAAWLGAGEQLALPVSWRFPARGEARLEGLELSSSFPFGLLEHRLVLSRPAPVLVFPAALGPPRGEAVSTAGSHQLDDDLVGPRGAGCGDFLDLRAYQPGDPPRLIHWPTTARLGRATVVVRGTESDEEVLVEIEQHQEPHRWERDISRACGQIMLHARMGRAVGLRVGTRSWPTRRGPSQHRSLLTALALLPHLREPRP